MPLIPNRYLKPKFPVQITHRDQLAAGQRSHALDQWQNQGTIVNATSITTTRGTTYAAFPIVPPNNAIAAILVTRVNSNTVTAGRISVRYYQNLTDNGDAAMLAACDQPMVSATGASLTQSIVPIVNAGISYSWDVTGGSVNADVLVYLVNFILA
jgi:hypothetical protein